jgi:hypothetical protein
MRNNKHTTVYLKYGSPARQRNHMNERAKRQQRAAIKNDMGWLAFFVILVGIYIMVGTQ